jgi:hypothetical protein
MYLKNYFEMSTNQERVHVHVHSKSLRACSHALQEVNFSKAPLRALQDVNSSRVRLHARKMTTFQVHSCLVRPKARENAIPREL